MGCDWRRFYRQVVAWHDALFVTKWRAGLARESRRQNDEFMAMLFLEAQGVATPMSYYALELYPEFVESFHQWHRRMGVDQFPDSGFCC